MAHSPSAIKRIRTNEKRRLINKSRMSATRTQIKAFLKAAEAGVREEADKQHALAVSAIDKSVKAGLYHPNKAARMKSKLAARMATVGK